jgi:hypothetical protein
VDALLARAMEKRSVGCTQMNEQSSRSHMVFTLRIDGVNASSQLKVRAATARQPRRSLSTLRIFTRTRARRLARARTYTHTHAHTHARAYDVHP